MIEDDDRGKQRSGGRRPLAQIRNLLVQRAEAAPDFRVELLAAREPARRSDFVEPVAQYLIDPGRLGFSAAHARGGHSGSPARRREATSRSACSATLKGFLRM